MTSFIEMFPELLNLGEAEVKVYKFLDETGESPAKEISAQTGVSYSSIHAVLYRLQQEGLVLSRGEAPKLFALRFKDPELPRLWPGKHRGDKSSSGGN